MKVRFTARDGGLWNSHIRESKLEEFKEKHPDMEVIE